MKRVLLSRFGLYVLLNLLFLNSFLFSQTTATEAGNYTTVEESAEFSPLQQNDSDALTIWALPTNGATSQNSRAPSNGWKYQRTEYLITPAEMTASGFPSGAVINALGYYISSAGSGNLSGTLNIYLKNTTDSVYSLGSSWNTLGFTHVSSNNPFSVPVSPSGGIYNITFSGGSVFTYTGGGLYVAWEFSSPDGTPGTVNVAHYCNNTMPNGLYGHRSGAGLPTVLSASDWRPATRFGTNTYDDFIDITNIYSLERVPVPFGVPPSVKVRLSNVSPLAVTFDLTLTVKDAVSSAVRYTSTQTLTNFQGYSSAVVNFPGWTPSITENVLITAETSVIPDETWTINNIRSINAEVNNNLYSYNYNMTNAGGYGYTYPNQGIFAAKYTMNGTGIVTGVNVFIYNYPANIGNTVYAVALNGAGVIVAQSDNYVIQSGDLGTVKNFSFSSPALFHNQIFYAGLAQTSGVVQYYPLGTFLENPQRGNTFYTFAIGGGTPNADNFIARYGIEAQVAASSAEVIDAGVVSIDINENQNPGTLIPRATVKNFGTNAQSFAVSLNISDGYISQKTVTALAPGAEQQVTFDNWNASLGQFSVNVCTQLAGDINPDNNCKTKIVGVYAGSWSSGTDFPISTYLGSGIGYKSSSSEVALDYFFSIAGNTTSGLATECFRYDVNAGTWSAVSSLPDSRRVFASVLLGDFIYVIGGSDLSSIYKSNVFKYNIPGNTWTNSLPLPIAAAWGKAAVYKNRIYFAGGVNSSGTVLSSVYVYDPVGNIWQTATPMPSARFGGAFAAAGNKLVYIGGADETDIRSEVWVGTVSDINPLNITWVNTGMYPGMEGEVFSNPDVKLADEIMMKGEINLQNPESYPPGSMYRFDAAAWGTKKIIAAGGSPGSAWLPAIPSPCYMYDPFENIWTKQADLPVPVLGASIGTVNNGKIWKLIAASGLGIYQAENVTQIWTDTTVAESFPFSLNINNNWNIISIPGLHPDNQGVNTWFPFRDQSAGVFKYNNGYQSVAFLETGKGYWLKHLGARLYNTGDEWPADGIFAVPHEAVPVITGWNIIAPYEAAVPVSAITTTPPSIQSGPIFAYTPSGYVSASSLVPGFGYWMKVTSSGYVNFPEGTFEKNDAPDNHTSGFGKIVITDNAGRSTTLYTAGEKADPELYELPPAPPPGIFDIRFAAGTFAEYLNVAKEILITGAFYPVTIKAEEVSLIITDETGKEMSRLSSGESLTISSKQRIFIKEDLLPFHFSLEQNYPNPFNPVTSIKFSLPEEANVNLSIFNILGEKVKELKNEIMKPGYYELRFDASDFASGPYLYHIEAGSFRETRKMILLK